MSELEKMTNKELFVFLHNRFNIADWKDVNEFEAELLRRLEEGENLKCCGNCELYGIDSCTSLPNLYCGHWQSDLLSQKERKK
jgi:hypothetical protein